MTVCSYVIRFNMYLEISVTGQCQTNVYWSDILLDVHSQKDYNCLWHTLYNVILFSAMLLYVCIVTGRKRRRTAPAISLSIAHHVLQQPESVKVLEQDDDNG